MASVAHKSHLAYLEEQRKLKEQNEKERLLKERNLEEEKRRSEELANKKESIEKLEDRTKAMAQAKHAARDSALSLLKEANQRLKKGIDKNDLLAVRIAQGMLEGAEKLREKEKSHEEKEAKLNKIVHKRKSNIIDSILSKKSKLDP